MNVQVLIDSIVRQVTVLLAQLATSGGIRAPVAHIANQVFVELANELAAQGVSRKVSADMFGMALRAYIRKLRRLSEGRTDQGKTLWQVMLDFIRDGGMVSRTRLEQRFERDDEVQVSAVLHDLVESGLVFCSGGGQNSVYRAASEQELGELARLSSEQGLDELVWAFIFSKGPLSEQELATEASSTLEVLRAPLQRLIDQRRVKRLPDGRLLAPELIIPLGASVGWEAAVFHHLQAVVQTICQRLRSIDEGQPPPAGIGGSTYAFDVWPGHPLEGKVQEQFSELRRRLSQLRQEVSSYNDVHGLAEKYSQVTTYVGQCVIERELGERDESELSV